MFACCHGIVRDPPNAECRSHRSTRNALLRQSPPSQFPSQSQYCDLHLRRKFHWGSVMTVIESRPPPMVSASHRCCHSRLHSSMVDARRSTDRVSALPHFLHSRPCWSRFPSSVLQTWSVISRGPSAILLPLICIVGTFFAFCFPLSDTRYNALQKYVGRKFYTVRVPLVPYRGSGTSFYTTPVHTRRR